MDEILIQTPQLSVLRALGPIDGNRQMLSSHGKAIELDLQFLILAVLNDRQSGQLLATQVSIHTRT